MNITLIGHLGYVGINIKEQLFYYNFDNLFFVDRSTSEEDLINYIEKSDIVVHCAGIQKPFINNLESFEPNFKLTKLIVDFLPTDTKLIFVSSIHYNSNTPFGLTRRREEEYIKSNISHYTIYHLPHTFGAHGKANYNNVFNTFLKNIINNNEIVLKDFQTAYSLISIRMFVTYLINNLNNDLFEVDKFDVFSITLPKFLFTLLKIHFENEQEDSAFFDELEFVYNQYKKL